ncbi:MAG TPA: ACP phosphodiesterase [Pseudomonadales bacterium]|nr:ACP phosphodiesterase [Pseudomonadales bacterium]
MNHLAHFKVAHPDPGLMVGGFLGDFVKGRLTGDYPHEVERGIRLHRAVDAFVDSHPVARHSVQRFVPPYRRFAPILVDVIYDHYLAELWASYHDEAIQRFCDAVFEALSGHASLLPTRARTIAERMMASRSMEQYYRDDFVAGSFRSLAGRLKRDNPMAEAFTEFDRLRTELREDFVRFFPDLMAFTENWQQEN